MALVLLDRQHAGKPTHLADRGAWGDLDHDGRVDVEEQEAALTARYLLAAELELLRLGHSALPLADGSYAERHARANKYAQAIGGRAVYIAAHLNAGGGRYGSTFYDARSTAGKALSVAVAAALRSACPELGADVWARAAEPTGPWARAYSTIAGVYSGRPVGLCFEPFFLDAPPHQVLASPEGLGRVGVALARGIDAWSRA